MDRLYRSLLRPLLFRLDAESAHRLALRVLPLVPHSASGADDSLRTAALGMDFIHPIGLAAGFDKDGMAARHLPRLGFGFLELGTVTPAPQEGNPRPRLFRFPGERALVNRMGFNNAGAEALAGRLARLRRSGGAAVPMGVNLGKQRETPAEQAVDDYRKLIDVLLPVADYLVINVSSPNTPGLRALEKGETLRRLLRGARRAVDGGGRNHAGKVPPLLVKLSPDMGREELEGAAAAAREARVDGLVVTNTTIDLGPLGSRAPSSGGLSGEPLREKALEALRVARVATEGALPLVASGGIMDAEDVYRRIRAGAALVQVYTGLIYGGPGLVGRMARRLAELLARDGFATVGEAVGTED